MELDMPKKALKEAPIIASCCTVQRGLARSIWWLPLWETWKSGCWKRWTSNWLQEINRKKTQKMVSIACIWNDRQMRRKTTWRRRHQARTKSLRSWRKLSLWANHLPRQRHRRSQRKTKNLKFVTSPSASPMEPLYKSSPQATSTHSSETMRPSLTTLTLSSSASCPTSCSPQIPTTTSSPASTLLSTCIKNAKTLCPLL